MRRAALCWLLLALLAARGCLAIRDFNAHAKELHRPVRRWGRKAETKEKTFNMEAMGRAAFDPDYAKKHDKEVDREQLGFDEDEAVEDGEEADVKNRLKEIWPLLDQNKDGYVDAEELWHWHAENGLKAALRRNEREFNRTDLNKDGFVTIQEYMQDIAEEDEYDDLSMDNVSEIADFEDWLGTIKVAFKLSDRDGDGKLNAREYFEFQNPEESDNEKLKYHVLRQDVHIRDDNYDGVLDWDEFFHGYWSSFHLWEHNKHERWDEEKDKAAARRKFVALDTNGDGKLDASELRAAFNDLHPNERRYARLQSDHMLEMADTNKDGRLTLKEALKNARIFYAVTENDEDDYNYHDEL